MSNREREDPDDRDSVIVEHSGGTGALVAAIGLLIALVAVLLYFDIIPI